VVNNGRIQLTRLKFPIIVKKVVAGSVVQRATFAFQTYDLGHFGVGSFGKVTQYRV